MSVSKASGALPNFGTLVRVDDPFDDDLKRTKFGKSLTSLSKLGKQSISPDEKDEVREENGVLFWVNKNGFPIDDKTWCRMWDHVAKIHPDSYNIGQKIRYSKEHPHIPVPQPPTSFPPTMNTLDKLELVQNYMIQLEYNHTGTQFYEIKKNRPLCGLMDVAKDMVKEALPIKCLEAVVLGIALTNGMMGVERFPIGFKTVFSGTVHRHVVLGMYSAGRWGALGMSRRDNLMYKPLHFKNLSELIIDFEESYKKYLHQVKKMKIGLPSPHDPYSYEGIHWKGLTLNMVKISQRDLVKEVDRHARDIRSSSKSWLTPHSPRKAFTADPSLCMRDSGARPQTKVHRSSSTVIPATVRSHSLDSPLREELRRSAVRGNTTDGNFDYQVRV